MADGTHLLRPGFQSSRGDQIIPALCALIRKMRELEQAQTSEPEQEDAGTTPGDSTSMSSAESHRGSERNLVQELRLKLLAAQLHSVRCHLRNKYPRITRNAKTNTENTFASANAATDNTRVFDDDLDQIPVKLTRTETPRHQNMHSTSPESVCYVSSLHSSSDLISRYENHQFTDEKTVLPEPAVQKTKTYIPPSRSNNESSLRKHHHFHLKLSNVPFILGTVRNYHSTSASHSLTANVQNIIGTLKTHNALCMHTPSPACPGFSAPKAQRKKDCNSVLKNLGRDFNKLSLQQKQLKDQLSENRNRHEKKAIHDQYKNISDLLQTKAQEIVECHTQVQSEKVLGARSQEKSRPNSEPLYLPRWDLP